MRPVPAPPLLFLALLLLLPACGGAEAEPLEPAPFDEARAWSDLEALVALGPRRIGSEASARAREYIRSQIEPHGWEIEEDPFTAVPPEGARRRGEIPGVNLLARRPGTEAGEIWLCSHYDTYDIAGMVGANDGGSSSAVLIECARQLGGEGPRQGPSLVLCWFDGEEPFPPVAWDDETNSTFGSRHLAERLAAEGRLQDIRALILLDMVGDADLGLHVERRSVPWLKNLFRSVAYRIGDPRLLLDEMQVQDDHLPFRKKGVDVLLLIDFAYGGPERHERLWHTREDSLEYCSAESLGRTGRLVLTALPLVEEQVRQQD